MALKMVRACSPSLAHNRVYSKVRLENGAEYQAMAGGNRCPAHDDPLAKESRTGRCLDNFWAESHLAALSLLDMFRLWRTWRKAAKR